MPESSSRVGFVAALAAEARTLGRARRLPNGLRSTPDGSLLAVSGMGFEAAQRSAQTLVDAGCTALVSWGLAGGLDPEVSCGAIVVPAVLMFEGASDLSAHSAWRERVTDVLGSPRGVSAAATPGATGGKLLTSRRPLASVGDKRRGFVASGAVAVDMESYAIAAVAASGGLPFIAIRVVVDAAQDEVPAAVLDSADAQGRLAAGRLLVRLLGSPQLLPPMLRLARRYAVARRVLRAAAQAGVPGRP